MREPKWTTTRWKLPGKLRKERLAQLLARSDLRDIFDKDFIKGVEERKYLLEGRQWKLLLIQLPLFLFLAFSLLDLKVTVTVVGISTEASKSLREILLLLSAAFGLGYSSMDREIGYLNDILKAFILKQAGKDAEVRDFLDVRYGMGEISPFKTFDENLYPGKAQLVAFFVWVAMVVVFISMLVVLVLAVQVLNLFAVYYEPNFSREASIFVIVFVLLADVATILPWLMTRSVQPYDTFEDAKKLDRLQMTDTKKWHEILRKMGEQHASKGIFRRIFGRPKMPRIRD